MARQNKEKYFNETIAYRNRNPLNIRYSKTVKWLGQEGEWRGFVRFRGFEYGYRAAVKILRTYQQRGIHSIRDIVRTWAPPNENKTDQYVRAVLQFMSPRQSEPYVVDSTTKIDLKNRTLVVQLLLAMTRVEMGANAAQVYSMRTYAEMGYDLAVTTPGFFS